MAAIIGALRAVLSLDSAAFETGLVQGQAGLKRFDASAKRIGAGIAALGASLAVVGAGIAVAVRGQLDRADQLGETAEKLGVGVAALSELDYAAKITGVSADTLEASIRILSKTMAQAADGNAQAAELFASVGVAVKDAAGNVRPANDVMADLADVFAGMPDGAQKTALALQLFGKSGADMLLMLNGGSEGLRAMAAEAANFGLVLTDETAEAAGKVNETLDRMRLASEGVSAQIMVALLPAMVALTDSLQEGGTLRNGINAVVSGISQVAQVLSATINVVVSGAGWLAELGGSATATSSTLGVLADAVSTAFAPFAYAIKVVSDLVVGFSNLIKATGSFGGALGLLADVAKEAFGRVKIAFELVPAAIKAGALQMATYFLMQVNRMLGAFVDFTWSVADGFNELFGTNLTGASVAGVQRVTGEILALQDAADAAAGEAVALGSALSAPMASVAALKSAVVAVGEEGAPAVAATTAGLAELGEEAEGAGGRGSAALKRMKEELKGADSVKSAVEGLGDSFREVFKGLVTRSMTVTDALQNIKNKLIDLALDSAFDRLFGGLFKIGTGTGAFGLPLPFANGGVFNAGRLQAFASGGIVSSPTTFAMRGGMGLMGEAGPEAIMPLTRGANGKLGVQAMGGGAVDVRVTVEASEDLRVVAKTEGRAGGVEAAAGFARRAQQGERRK